MKEYFPLSEFIYSANAVKAGVQNTPNATEEANIRETISQITPLRIAWGNYVAQNWPTERQGINISSGFRNDWTNKAAGGSSTSAHRVGWAADLQPSNGRIKEFKAFVLKWLADNPQVKYDQVILERSATAEWVHYGVKNQQGLQRMQKFSLNV